MYRLQDLKTMDDKNLFSPRMSRVYVRSSQSPEFQYLSSLLSSNSSESLKLFWYKNLWDQGEGGRHTTSCTKIDHPGEWNLRTPRLSNASQLFLPRETFFSLQRMFAESQIVLPSKMGYHHQPHWLLSARLSFLRIEKGITLIAVPILKGIKMIIIVIVINFLFRFKEQNTSLGCIPAIKKFILDVKQFKIGKIFAVVFWKKMLLWNEISNFSLFASHFFLTILLYFPSDRLWYIEKTHYVQLSTFFLH